VLAPHHDPKVAQALEVGLHYCRRSGLPVGQNPDTLGQVDDRLGPPAQQPLVKVVLLAVGRDVAQVGQVRQLGVDQRMKIRAAAPIAARNSSSSGKGGSSAIQFT
jgi:hypothetical protein